ncbi:2,3-epoxybenzoyl-CoA dihydrolase [Novispirillum sp. DQ9]|uniref:2,3-epoxybenzoyl-CoA dihydrolase n=1 Tax=Novispirillum sp. DQ9 TaxID=3398612 RepID=UPI003C7D3361
MIDFQTHPDRYKHWKLSVDGAVATLKMDVDPKGGLFDGYELKMNSYDLGVDIELYDAIQRLRFEHPEVGCVVLASANEKIFCAGANIRMLGKSTHAHKVNFCKFTNETRLSIEDATEFSRQFYMCAVNGTAAGGGYELALAADWIMMVDDSNSAVSLPEVPLLAVLPGTGGLTRLVDKRKVRRDRADVFCTVEEGVRGQRAVDWRLVDEVLPPSAFAEAVARRAAEFAARTDRPRDARGVILTPLERTISDSGVRYRHVTVDYDRDLLAAEITVHGPTEAPPADAAGIAAQGVDFWGLAACRDLDDAILHLRLNEPELTTWIFRTAGNADLVAAYDDLMERTADDWLSREIRLYWRRTLKRVDTTSRSIIAQITPGSCFAGTLLELALAADRAWMLEGQFEGDNRPPATVRLTAMNFGPMTMGNGLTRLQTRFLGEPESVDKAKAALGSDLDAQAADELGLITAAMDDIDWEDEVRVMLEERASFSSDALTGLEANLRFAGPETMETKIFGRLSAWQNWIFQRPNAAGENGALKLYGTGKRATYDRQRV